MKRIHDHYSWSDERYFPAMKVDGTFPAIDPSLLERAKYAALTLQEMEAGESEPSESQVDRRAVTIDQLVTLLRLAGSGKSRGTVEGWAKKHDFPEALTTSRPKTYRFQAVKDWIMENQAIEIIWPESQLI